jgi:hypothetical protein
MPFRRHRDDADDRSQILSGEPFRAEAPVDHHDGEHTVELAAYATRFGADVAVAALQARGITAGAIHGGGAGWAANPLARGVHRVLVFEKDLEIARALLVDEAVTPEELEAD